MGTIQGAYEYSRVQEILRRYRDNCEAVERDKARREAVDAEYEDVQPNGLPTTIRK